MQCANNMSNWDWRPQDYEGSFKQFPPAGKGYNFGALTVSYFRDPIAMT